jgi:mycoredoxin
MLTLYATPDCGHCHRLKTQLAREAIPYSEVNVETDPIGAQYVMSVNGGNRVVPTVLFDNGTALTNPTIVQIKQRLLGIAADKTQ